MKRRQFQRSPAECDSSAARTTWLLHRVRAAAAFARRIAFESNIDLFREMKKARLVRDFEVLFDIVPYIHEEGRARSVPSIYDYMRQAEVTIMATSSDDTIDRIVALVADAGSYAPKKEPSA